MEQFAARGVVKTLQERFSKTRQDSDDPKDFVIESSVDQGSFEVHSFILSGQSPFFLKVVTSPFKESDTKVLKMPKSGEAIEQMVRFMYGFELDIKTMELAREIVEMAKMYDIKFLEEAAAVFISKALDSSNALTRESNVTCCDRRLPQSSLQ